MFGWLKAAWSTGGAILAGWQGFLIKAAGIAAIGAAIWLHGYTRGTDRGAATLSACHADLARAQDGIADLKASIASQGAAIAAVADQAAKLRDAVAKELEAARTGREAAEREAARLRGLKGAPAAKAGACPAAAALEEVRKGLR